LLFNSYIGAVYAESGFGTIRQWIRCLLGSGSSECHSVELPCPQPPESPPLKKLKSEFTPSTLPPRLRAPYAGTSALASQATASTSMPDLLAPAQPNLPFLQSFHEEAKQRRVAVAYVTEFSGPTHAGVWTVKCVGKYPECLNLDYCY